MKNKTIVRGWYIDGKEVTKEEYDAYKKAESGADSN